MAAADFDALWRSLKKGVLRSVYYLHGDEELLKDEALRCLVDAGADPATRDFNLDRRRAPETAAEDLHALVHTPPMMAARRVVVLQEVEFLQQRKPRAQALRQAVLSYAAQPAADTMLILVQSASPEKADGRERLLSPDPALARVAATYDFGILAPDRLRGWVAREAGKLGLMIEDAAVDHLLAVVGGTLPALAAELSKVAAAVGSRTATTDDVADVAGVRRGETVPDFVDAVTGRRVVVAAEMVPRLLDAPGASAVRLVSALGTAFTGLGLARALLDGGARDDAVERQICAALDEFRPGGLRKWSLEARTWTRDARRWTSPEIDSALEELLRADRRLKRTTVAGGAEIVREALYAMAASPQVAVR